MVAKSCFHCGNPIKPKDEIDFDLKSFCCNGCKTVYELFSQNDLMCYYDFENAPGATPQEIKGKYDYLDDDKIIEKLLEFQEDTTSIVSLYIPHIHCSSCIWILENLQKIELGILSSQVNFSKKEVRITYNPEKVSLKKVVILLNSIGYEPYICLENFENKPQNINRSLFYKLGVAFFCFGNIMLLSFPEYFEVEEFWINQYRGFFRWLIFALALPSFFYSASDYYISAYKSIKSKMLNIDVPIALGIIVMFFRSTIDIMFDYGQGFFDSLTGLVFFMLLGKLFQQKTYRFLSFERDYKSYFPIAITKLLKDGKEVPTQVYDIQKGDRLLIRNQELIPVDGILISTDTLIDYSFVTGEADAIQKRSGDKVYAGGKVIGNAVEIEVLLSVSQSYLTQLWSNDVFQKKSDQKYKSITDKVSQYFTPSLLILALIVFVFWLPQDIAKAFNVLTAVLIVACPCALALTAPFTLGNVLRIMGKQKLYLKNANVIEQLAKVDTIVFDKTGTITSNYKSSIEFVGSSELSLEEQRLLKSAFRGSNHPLSRKIYEVLPDAEPYQVNDFHEIQGKGIVATINNTILTIGSCNLLEIPNNEGDKQTKVHIKIGNSYKGYYVFDNQYRDGIQSVFQQLIKKYQIKILSGDNEGERETLKHLLPYGIEMKFNQKPEQKLEFIDGLQKQGKNVLMIGDGLNDAGALAQSNVGISISENVNVFSPACDGIMDATQFSKIGYYLHFSKNAMKTIYMSFILSLLYNLVGLSFAISGTLSPLVAAIIMPLSSITIVSFVTLLSNYFSKKINNF